MEPQLDNHNNVRAICSNCGTLATFDFKQPDREFGYIDIQGSHDCGMMGCNRLIYRLLRCSGCHKGAVAEIHHTGVGIILASFYPHSIERLPLPKDVPDGIEHEFREAELCKSATALRASLALFGSVLEKVLKQNGYTSGNLEDKINEAARDGVITASRKIRAHTKIRNLRNDVLHEPWREVKKDEVDDAHVYTQRVLEDFYDDRDTVETLLKKLGKIPEPVAVSRV